MSALYPACLRKRRRADIRVWLKCAQKADSCNVANDVHEFQCFKVINRQIGEAIIERKIRGLLARSRARLYTKTEHMGATQGVAPKTYARRSVRQRIRPHLDMYGARL
jgi:hypothetical protein